MDSDNDGLGRLGDGAYANDGPGTAAPRVIRADIAWRGPEARRPTGPTRSSVAVRPAPVEDRSLEEAIIGSSPKAQAMRDQIRLYAEVDAPVLITGETGAGKELVARQLHRQSARRGRPFIALNAGAMPETLAAAEFFGHAKGAFTGAVSEREGAFIAADGGVLFLDEIGDMPLSIQTQLLRVLDDGVVVKLGSRSQVKTDFRMIAATNVDLSKSVAHGSFRRDLLYRLNVLTIETPPLRERGDDVVEIAEQIIATHPDPRARNAKLTPAAADALKAHPFPGNVRELRNVMMRALVHAGGGKILPAHLALGAARSPAGQNLVDATEIKELAARFAVLKALRLAGGNVSRAAELAGRSRSSIHALTKELGEDGGAAEYEQLRKSLRAVIED